MIKRLTYPLILGAVFLAGCSGASNPMPRTLDLPEDMDPRLKDFFTICPIAMSSTEYASNELQEAGWEQREVFEENRQASWIDAHMFEKDEAQFSLYISHQYDSAGVFCSLTLLDYDSEIFDKSNFSFLNDIGFKGAMEGDEEGGQGQWMLGNYPYGVYLSINKRSDVYANVSLMRYVPKSDPIYNR